MNRLINYGLVIILTLFTLLFLEFVLRSVFPQINEHNKMFQSGNILGWTFIPNKISNIIYDDEINNQIQINEFGFRDNTFQSANKRKILVTGDSFVSNIFVPDKLVFTESLEIFFDSTIIINCGVNGYGQVQSYLQMKKWLPKIKSELIIHQIYLRNDFYNRTFNGSSRR